MKEISIIIPTFNEKENIHRLIKNLKKVVPKAYIVIVDDSIDDEIGKIVKKNKYLNVKYYKKNFWVWKRKRNLKNFKNCRKNKFTRRKF